MMSLLSRLGEKALTTGVNAALPVYAKVAGAVSGLSSGPAGKVVGSVLEKSHELASPVIDPVLRKLGHGGNGSSAPKTVPDVQKAAADAVSAPSPTSPVTSPAKKSPAKKPAAQKPAAQKTSAKKSTRKPAGDPTRKAVPEPSHKAEPVTHADIVTPGAPVEVNEMSLPIAGYSRLAVDKIPARLVGLTNSELALLFKYERANKNRAKVTDAIDAQLVDLPMPTYDKMTSPAILDSLNGLTRGELRTIKGYEARTTNRLPIIDRIDELLAIEA
jgi:hypothetical protein